MVNLLKHPLLDHAKSIVAIVRWSAHPQAQAFRDTSEHILAFRPSTFVCENVCEFADRDSMDLSPLDMFLAGILGDMQKAGYEVSAYTLDLKEWNGVARPRTLLLMFGRHVQQAVTWSIAQICVLPCDFHC
eukprot:859467-Amphidinium_carterae.2